MATKTTQKVKRKKSFPDPAEIIGWLMIVGWAIFVSGIIGFIAYKAAHSLILGIAIVALGLFLGILWANKIARKRSTIDFVSRVNASPELDNLQDQEN
jgi:hypothetical protein